MGMPDVGLAKGQRPAPVTAAPFFRDEVLPIRTSRWNRPKLLMRCSTISPRTPSCSKAQAGSFFWTKDPPEAGDDQTGARPHRSGLAPAFAHKHPGPRLYQEPMLLPIS